MALMSERVLPGREDALAALGWFFDGPYLDHAEVVDNLVAIVALWKADRKPRVVSDG